MDYLLPGGDELIILKLWEVASPEVLFYNEVLNWVPDAWQYCDFPGKVDGQTRI